MRILQKCVHCVHLPVDEQFYMIANVPPAVCPLWPWPPELPLPSLQRRLHCCWRFGAGFNPPFFGEQVLRDPSCSSRELVLAIHTFHLCTCCQALAHLEFLHAATQCHLSREQSCSMQTRPFRPSFSGGEYPSWYWIQLPYKKNKNLASIMYPNCISRVSVLFSPCMPRIIIFAWLKRLSGDCRSLLHQKRLGSGSEPTSG